MPSVADYELLVPFTIDELVDAANSILRERPSRQIQSRTVRYYISGGLLPPPQGGPKFARYGIEHLRRIVAIRRWLDEGFTLEQAAVKIENGEHGGERRLLQRGESSLILREPTRPLSVRSTDVRRIQLTPTVVLEIAGDGDQIESLEMAASALQDLIDTSRH